jgi:hypothetical protein
MADDPELDHADHYAKSGGGLFDIRNIIAALFAIYGLILTSYGIAHHCAADTAKAGVNINLWAGIAMLVVAAVFGSWAALRPVRVPADRA